MEFKFYLEGSRANGFKVLATGNSQQIKHKCYSCSKKSLVKFVDISTNEYVDGPYGKCDHENKCGYYSSPYKDAQLNTQITANWPLTRPIAPPQKLVFIPDNILNATMKGYEQNKFIMNLLNNIPFPFEKEDIDKVIDMYRLGTVTKGYRTGAITMPYIDIEGNTRAIQVKHFDKSNHTTSTDYIHSMIEKDCRKNRKNLPDWLNGYLKNERFISSLFGAHLLYLYPNNPIALVESPKTAIIGTLYYGFPDNPENLLWLAVYNRSSYNYEKSKVLKERDVVVFPDLGAFDDWTMKTEEISKLMPSTNFFVDERLEANAEYNDKKKGLDFADYLIKFDWRTFRPSMASQPEVEEKVRLKTKVFHAIRYQAPLPKLLPKKPVMNWQVDELVQYFNERNAWPAKVILDSATTILDPIKFIEGHIAAIHLNNGNPKFQPYLDRLQKFRELTLLVSSQIPAVNVEATNQNTTKEIVTNSDWEHG